MSRSFRPAIPPYAARDSRCDGAIVLVIGHWVDDEGREIAAQIVPSTQRRRLIDVTPLPLAPAARFAPVEDAR